jgi:hypothetical protein
MPLTIGHLTTEVIAEPDARGADDPPAPARDAPEQVAAMRRELAVMVRNEMRTRAERFDD